MIRFLTISFACLVLVLEPAAELHAQKTWAPFRFSYMKRIVRKLKRFTKEPGLEDLAFRPGTTVIGVEPSWLLEEKKYGHYYYKMLTDVVVGEYDVNLYTGLPRNPKGPKKEFETTAKDSYEDDYRMLQLATFENPQIRGLLQVNLLDEQHSKEQKVSDAMKQFLRTKTFQFQLKTNIDTCLNKWQRQYNMAYEDLGILLNYEIIFLKQSEDLKKNFVALAESLKFKKKQDDDSEKSRLLYIRLPDLRKESKMRLDSVTLAALNKQADLFLIKDYGYELLSECYYCPNLPIDSKSEYSLPKLVDHYHKVLGIPKDKLIVESSFHANRLPDELEQPELQEKLAQGLMKDSLKYFEIKPKYLTDSTSCAYFKSPNNARFYYADSITYSRKLAWINKEQLAGVSLWGLGYIKEIGTSDKDKTMWKALAKHYAELPVQSGWFAASITFFLVSMSLVYAVVVYWDVRNILDRHRPYLIKLSWIPILFSIITLTCLDIIPRQFALYVIIGAISLFFLLYLLVRRAIMRVRKYLRYIGIKI